MSTPDVDVAIVGGGPAGALLATHLARAGHAVAVLERSPTYRWRACGVFSSPATVAALRRAGLDEAALARAIRAIPAMRVETPAGTTFRLTYGGDETGGGPVGFDRSALDPALLDLARAAGADVREGVRVEEVRAGPSVELTLGGPLGRGMLRARIVAGADGCRSVVARSVGVARRSRLGRRVGLTFHVAEPGAAPHAPTDARLRVIADGYVGLAPVPGGRVNVGIVLGSSWDAALARDGAAAVAERVLAEVAPGSGRRLDAIAGASPIAHAVARRAGDRWLLVGDAAGFLDPFTGEGLHRAVVSADLAAAAVDAALRSNGPGRALAAYDRTMRARFTGKDLVSWLVQGFLGRPALFEYAARRLAARNAVRETMGLVMGDLVPASRALDPRYLAALLRP